MALEIGIFLSYRDDHGVSLLEFVVNRLQLDQLLGAKRSPVRSVEHNDDVGATQIILERNHRSISLR